LAIGAGINDLDLRQFEMQIPGIVIAPSNASAICQFLKSKNKFSFFRRKSLQT
jgi:hypothetical protein